MLNSFNKVKLKNGSETGSMVVTLSMVYLRQLFEADIETFNKLLKACADNEDKLSRGLLNKLERYHLSENGALHESVKDILLSAVTKISDALILLDSPI